jgi:hypothetical protein
MGMNTRHQVLDSNEVGVCLKYISSLGDFVVLLSRSVSLFLIQMETVIKARPQLHIFHYLLPEASSSFLFSCKIILEFMPGTF